MLAPPPGVGTPAARAWGAQLGATRENSACPLGEGEGEGDTCIVLVCA